MAGQRSLLVLYGSQTGCAQEVAERVGREAIRHRFAAQVLPFDSFPMSQLPKLCATAVVCVVSTTGQGEMPDNMKRSWSILLRKALPANLLSGISFAVFGLGDSSYAEYNYAGKKLFRRLQALGANALVPRGDGDDQHPLGCDAALDPWLQQLWNVLLEVAPLPPSLPVIPSHTLLPPRYSVAVSAPQHGCESATRVEEEDKLYAQTPPFNISRPYAAVVTKNERLTATDWQQEVRHIEFSIHQSMQYQPGAVLCVVPRNPAPAVDRFIELVGVDAVTVITQIDANGECDEGPNALSTVPTPLSMHDLATYYLDICGTPRRFFFEVMAHFATAEMEKERLLYFASAEGQEDLRSYNHKEKRTVVEVLEDFPSARPPLEYLLDIVPRVQAREFSIASSFALHSRPTAQLCVAIVRFRTPYGRAREGLCTSFMQRLRCGDRARVWVREASPLFRLPAKQPTRADIVMVGPGTGLAPFRAFCQELRHLDSEEERNQLQDAHDSGSTGDDQNRIKGKRFFYFGCRHKDKDFLYEDDWKSFVHDGVLSNVYTAFSRDQPQKVYVQHHMRQHGAEIWSSICPKRGGFFFLSGSATQLPKDIKGTLIAIAAQWGKMDERAAAAYIAQMVREKRYCQEVWQ